MSVLALHHVSLVVEDTARALDFYHGILGIAIDEQRPELGFPGAWLKIGDHQIHLLEVENVDPVLGRPAHGGRDRHVAMLVGQLDLIENKLHEAGISFTRSKSGRKAIFCRDPDGNGVELIEVSRDQHVQ